MLEKSEKIATCTRKLEFDAGHRVVNHESKCRNFHGHRYVVEATFECEKLDSLGRVVDFGVIKQVYGKWIDDNLDHTMILNDSDKEAGMLMESLGNKPVFFVDFNPTAENLSKFLYEKANELMAESYNLKCTKIKLWETPNCFCEYEG